MCSQLKSFVQINAQYPLRMGIIYTIVVVIVVISVIVIGEKKSQLNIVLIIADDLGWNDVSFHGSDQIFTPNIDLLAYSGIALDRYYSHSICTPARSALLTGKFAYKLGMQGYPLTNSEDRGLSLTEKLLPQYLKNLGYMTHLVGKWHVGSSRSKYLPTNRGFDSHFGHRGGFLDYYEYTTEEQWNTGKVSGLDLYRNLTAAWDVEGYLTDIYTEEAKSIIKSHDTSKPLFLTVAHHAPHGANDGAILQAPPEYVRAMRHVESPERRIYAAMVKKLDESVGDIIESLMAKQILHKTLIAFISDNGGMTSGSSLNYGSNWPLRGLKMSPFEGGVRVVGLLWNPNLLSNHIWKGYMHVVDWLPTILGAVGAEPPLDTDGIDLWNQIKTNDNSSREEIIEIDDYTGYAAIISADFKLVIGNVTLNYSNHQGGDLRGVIGNLPSYENSLKKSKMYSILNKIGKPFNVQEAAIRGEMKVNCNFKTTNLNNICYPQNEKTCLFDIKQDPCETEDLSEDYPGVVESLRTRLLKEMDKKISRVVPLYRNPKSEPKFFNYTWATFADNL